MVTSSDLRNMARSRLSQLRKSQSVAPSERWLCEASGFFSAISFMAWRQGDKRLEKLCTWLADKTWARALEVRFGRL